MPWVLPNYFQNPFAGRQASSQQGGPIQSPAPMMGGKQYTIPGWISTMSPLFGRPGWTYTDVKKVPSHGPTPRLSQGTGLTGSPANRQQHGFIPNAYVTVNDYRPDGFDYQPKGRDKWLQRIPKTIAVGSDGVELVGTYRAHDFTPAEYGTRQWRSAPNWQDMTYPAGWRNLVGWQQVARYNLYQAVQQSAPLPQSNYFLGYTTQPNIASTLPQAGGFGAF